MSAMFAGHGREHAFDNVAIGRQFARNQRRGLDGDRLPVQPRTEKSAACAHSDQEDGDAEGPAFHGNISKKEQR